MNDVEVHILQPNSKVVLEKIKQNPATAITISKKTMEAVVTIPNKFRNNTITYTFELNMDSDLEYGDYLEMQLTGAWTYFLENCKFI